MDGDGGGNRLHDRKHHGVLSLVIGGKRGYVLRRQNRTRLTRFQSVIRDLQHHMQVNGWRYVIELCAPSTNPAPVRVGPFDVHIITDVSPEFDDKDVEPRSESSDTSSTSFGR